MGPKKGQKLGFLVFQGGKNLATHFLDKLEQKVKHVAATKLVTDQESSRFQYVCGTLVIFVLVYCPWSPGHLRGSMCGASVQARVQGSGGVAAAAGDSRTSTAGQLAAPGLRTAAQYVLASLKCHLYTTLQNLPPYQGNTVWQGR